MPTIGVIGTGSMGRMLIRALIAGGAASPEEVIASSRSAAPLLEIARETGITALGSNRAVAGGADVVFLCVRPSDVRGVLEEVGDCLDADTLLVSIASDVPLSLLAGWTGARLVRVIPSITSAALKGVTLVVRGPNADESDMRVLHSLLGAISTPVECGEDEIEVMTALTSCGPAFFAAFLRECAASAVRTGMLSPERAETAVRETFIGTAALLDGGMETFEEIIDAVATPGGITEAGVQMIGEDLPPLFDRLLQTTITRHAEVKARIGRTG
ncbi:pyrroline-5-carboxylate reductase family protein [Methanofollis fontis]|nr:pyrroline-5-carboxylate reductase [Methanofollis fontis]